MARSGAMRRGRTLIGVLLAALLVVVAVLLTPRPAASPLPSMALGRERQPAFADSGSAADVAQVRRAVQAALTDESNAAVMQDASTPALTHDRRVALLARNEVPPRAEQMAAAVEFSLGERPFVATGRFAVQRWQGVLVSGRTAKAYVTGFDQGRQLDGTPWRDGAYQARLLLVRSASAQHGWLVTKVVSSVEG